MKRINSLGNHRLFPAKDKCFRNNMGALVDDSQATRDLAFGEAIEYVMLDDAQGVQFGKQSRAGTKRKM